MKVQREKFCIVGQNGIEQYVKSSIISSAVTSLSTPKYKYHHNTKYANMLGILDYGILSMREQHSNGIKRFNNEMLNIIDDEDSHINGADGISLAISGLTDLSRDEEEYDPCTEGVVDLLISDNIKASRKTHHYGNEFISYSRIPIEDINGIDLRILRLIKNYESHNDYNSIIRIYNILLDFCRKMKNNDINIPLREMSYKALDLDINKLSKKQKLYLKRSK